MTLNGSTAVGDGRSRSGWLRAGLVPVLLALGVGVACAAIVGPLWLDLLDYRTSSTTRNQLLGSDAAGLLLVAPTAVVSALLVLRRSPLGPPLATGVGLYGIYTYAQVIVGQEYLRLPGNVERFFPLLLALFLLAETAVVLGLLTSRHLDPRPTRRLERITAWTLLLIAVFLVVGLHLPSMVTAWEAPESLQEYASSPTPFWLVKLMDLGVVVPALGVTAVGLLSDRSWARWLLPGLLSAYSMLAASVFSMAVVMLLRDDPDGSPTLAIAFGAFLGALVVLLGAWLRRLRVAPTPVPREADDLGASSGTTALRLQPQQSRV